MNILYEKPVFRLAGDSCIFMEIGNDINLSIHLKIRGILEYFENKKFRGIREITPAYRSINVYFDPLETTHEKIIAILNEAYALAKSSRITRFRKIYIPTVFGGDFGPDLQRVANIHNLTTEQVVNIFTSSDYLNYFNGFMPGKPYLGGIPKILETPRLDTPRFNVKMGAVVIYGKQAAIFGLPEPSGTNWIGTSPIRIYDVRKKEPVLLKMGDHVHFYKITEYEYDKIYKEVEAQTYEIKIELFEAE